VAFAALGCASGPRGVEPTPGAPNYPPRPPGCKVALFNAAAPPVPAWDDLGTAEVICYVDVPEPQCLQRLRAEVCRRGGDLVYDVPAKPLRPTDQGMVFRGKVAHTREHKADQPPDVPPPPMSAPGEPITPLPRAIAPDNAPQSPDAGNARDATVGA
jgi:hypothetical protein